MKKGILFFVSAIAAGSALAFTVTDVSARQRYPWNNIVDVDFTIGEASDADTFRVEIKATYAGGDHILEASKLLSDPVVKKGKNCISWAIGEDYPGLKAEDVKVAVSITPFSTLTPVYMVVDLSGGASAKSYGVRYCTKDPVHTPKANDKCKTTELWLRRIKADGIPFSFRSTKTPEENNQSFNVKLTKDYYIGVFETTQQQWYQITGNWISYMSNETWRATRPLDNFCPKLLWVQDHCKWPDVKEPISSSLLKKLRDKTGLPTLNLPTEAQWQFAACAGAAKQDRYCNENGDQYSLDEIARYYKNATNESYSTGLCDADSGTACVGTYKPNKFGLYDVIGNVTEDCLDPYVPFASLKEAYSELGYTFPIENPEGVSIAKAKEKYNNNHRVIIRGGKYKNASPSLWSAEVGTLHYTGNSDDQPHARGMRFCVTCE